VMEIATLPVAGDIAVSTALRRWRGSWKPWAKPSSEPSDWRRGNVVVLWEPADPDRMF